MNYRTQLRSAALVIAWLPLVACGRNQATEESVARAVKVEPIAGTELSRLTLSAQAAQRLDIQTADVRSALVNGTLRKVIPYAAVLYDDEGQAWAYTSLEPLTFVRTAVAVEFVTGDLAVLSIGPGDGVAVVTVGAEELFGSEEEFEEE